MDLESVINNLQIVADRTNEFLMSNVWIENDEDGFTGWRYDKYGVQLRIVCAAIQYGNYTVTGVRHFCPMMMFQIGMIGRKTLLSYGKEVQGFVDQYGLFRTREEAYDIAEKAGQIRRRDSRITRVLYSENLY